MEERGLLAAYVSSGYFWLTCAANGDGANFEAAMRSRFTTLACSALSDADVSEFRARVRGATDTLAALLSRWTRRPESRAPPSFLFRGLRVSDDDDAALQLGTRRLVSFSQSPRSALTFACCPVAHPHLREATHPETGQRICGGSTACPVLLVGAVQAGCEVVAVGSAAVNRTEKEYLAAPVHIVGRRRRLVRNLDLDALANGVMRAVSSTCLYTCCPRRLRL